jgi:hypothetical protein
MPQDGVEFSIVSAGPSGGWRVQIRLAADHIQYIYGFDTQLEATEWVECQAGSWLKALQAEL